MPECLISLRTRQTRPRRQELASGIRNALAGATLDTYESWRNQTQPSAAWARRYEGVPDPQLGRPAHQFAGAMEYLDWSVADQKDEAKAKRLKYAFEGVVFALAVVLIIASVREYRQQRELLSAQKNTLNVQQAKVQDLDSAQNLVQSYVQAARAGSRQGLDQTQTQDLLDGLASVGQQPQNAVTGHLYLGTLDETKRKWTPNSPSRLLTFKPPLSGKQPIIDELQQTKPVITTQDFNNLREASPRGKVLRIVRPKTKLKVEDIDLHAGKAVWATVRVIP